MISGNNHGKTESNMHTGALSFKVQGFSRSLRVDSHN